MTSNAQKLPFFQPILSLAAVFFTAGFTLLLLATPFSVSLVNTFLKRPIPLDQPQNLQTIAYVVDLPAQSQILSAYSQAELAHLADVRTLIRMVIFITLACFIFILFTSHRLSYTQSFLPTIKTTLQQAGLVLTLLPVVLAVFGLLVWNFFFESFHRLLFPPGTYTFPANSLLIQLYPESFWQTMFLIYGLMLLAAGIVYFKLSRKLVQAISS